jgi:putative NADPH-quinone reductase
MVVSRVGGRNLTLPERRSLSTSPWDLDRLRRRQSAQEIAEIVGQRTDKRMAAVLARARIGERIACNHRQAEHVIEFAIGQQSGIRGHHRAAKLEHDGYFTTPYDSKAIAGYVARLRLAKKLGFVFPQWWFNVPAILKVDRVLVPGVAFDHASGGGRWSRNAPALLGHAVHIV